MNRLILLSFILLSSCEFAQFANDQKDYIENIKVAKTIKFAYVIHDIELISKRGAISTKYFCSLQKGQYKLCFESKSGEFYLNPNDNFQCENMKIGGIVFSKKESRFLPWTYEDPFSSKKEILENFKSDDFVKKFDELTTDRPFIHGVYEIPDSLIQLRNN
ncbi:MAG: hypothetical protein MRY83_21510 [Flavobacteriales bacterium]|nr:hypothetical protein [Flavobacteriales bacterium]